MRAVERWLRKVDQFQQRHRPIAFTFGVVKKFGDDRAGALAALIAHSAFIAVFPLLLLLTTVLGFLMEHNPELQRTIVNSALRDFPIVGEQLGRAVHPLKGSGLALAAGVIGLVWGSLGLSQNAQVAMAEVWNIPGVERPGFVPRLVRSLAVIGALGVGIAATTAATGALTAIGGPVALVLGPIVTAALNVGLFVVGFRVLTPGPVGTRDLLPGAIVGAIGWTLLQFAGAVLVGHNLRNASQLYGFFASVLGLLSWLYLGAQLLLYSAEINVVKARRLWPRSLIQPPLTDADKRTLDDIARQGERRPEQSVRSIWKRNPLKPKHL